MRKQERNRFTMERLDHRLYVSPAQLSELLDIGWEKTNEIVRRHLPVVRLGPRSRRIPAAAVKVFLETQTKE
jgi:hypothetical protein